MTLAKQPPLMKVSADLRNPLTRLIRFDEQPVVQAPVEALAPPLYERFRTARTRDQGLEIDAPLWTSVGKGFASSWKTASVYRAKTPDIV